MNFILIYPPSSERAPEFPVGGLFLAHSLKKIGMSTKIICDKKLHEIYAEIDKLEKTEAQIKKFAHHRELFAWIVSPGLGLLLLEILLRHTMFRRLP